MSARSSFPRKTWLGLLIVLLLLLLVRAAAVLALGDVFFYGEELEKGTAAKAILDGLPLPHHALAYHPYEGGGFVVSHLKAVAFVLVGENLLAHKLVGFVTCAAVLAAGWRLLARHFSLRAAWSFGLLFVFAPESFQKLSLLSLGIHFEACLFVLLLLDALLRWSLDDEPLRGREAFGTGLIAGFGLYFSYQIVLVLAYAALVLLFVRRDRLFGRTGAWALSGFAVGVSPLIAMWAWVGSAVLDIHGTDLTQVRGAWDSLRSFFGSVYRDAKLGAYFWPLLGGVAVLLSMILGPPDERRRRLLLCGFLGLWLLAYLSSAFVVGEVNSHFDLMRFAPPWIVIVVLLAAVLDFGLGRVGIGRPLAGSALLFALALGLQSSWRIASEGQAGRWSSNLELLRSTKGYDYGGWLAKVWPRLAGSDAQRLEAMLAFEEPHPELLRADLADMAWKASVDRPALLDLLRQEGETEWAQYARGLGGWALEHGPERGAGGDLAEALNAVQHEAEPLGTILPCALGRAGGGRAFLPESFAEQVRQALAAGAPDAYFEGLGLRAHRWLVLAPYGGQEFRLRADHLAQRAAETDPRAVPGLLRGLEEGQRLHTLPSAR